MILPRLTLLAEQLAAVSDDRRAELRLVADAIASMTGLALHAAFDAAGDAIVPGEASDAPATFLGTGTIERLKSVRAAEREGQLRVVIELARAGRLYFAGPGRIVDLPLDAVAAAARIGELASARPDSRGEAQAVERLTARVLHEIGNPLAYATLATAQLARTVETEVARTYASELGDSVRKMADLLTELRQAARGVEGAAFVGARSHPSADATSGTESAAPSPGDVVPTAKSLLLIVDDEVPLARALAAALEPRFEVEIATSCSEAEARVLRGGVALVLCDFHLPDGSGLELFERLHQRLPALRFALASGGLAADAMVRARESGIPVFHKPFDAVRLAQELADL
ncbi:MAG: hybrid sensor histidine kinase/response regulator [Myxococcales bacterium]|nr:hybrid sensor histidine kinase/response regulator [Myxococcales bacterium]